MYLCVCAFVTQRMRSVSHHNNMASWSDPVKSNTTDGWTDGCFALGKKKPIPGTFSISVPQNQSGSPPQNGAPCKTKSGHVQTSK